MFSKLSNKRWYYLMMKKSEDVVLWYTPVVLPTPEAETGGEASLGNIAKSDLKIRGKEGKKQGKFRTGIHLSFYYCSNWYTMY